MKKAILFDLDDTVFDFKRSEKEALSCTLEYYGVQADDDTLALYSRINESMWKKLELGEMTRDQVLTKRFDLFFESIGAEIPNSDEVWHRYESNLSKSWYYIDGAEQVLSELCPIYDLYIVSNGTASVQDGRIQDSGVGKYFKKIFISQRVGYNKPDRRFFEVCFKEMEGLSPSDCCIVGDSLSSDIKGGLDFGITTVWYNPENLEPKGIKPDYQIDDIRSLPIVAEMILGN